MKFRISALSLLALTLAQATPAQTADKAFTWSSDGKTMTLTPVSGNNTDPAVAFLNRDPKPLTASDSPFPIIAKVDGFSVPLYFSSDTSMPFAMGVLPDNPVLNSSKADALSGWRDVVVTGNYNGYASADAVLNNYSVKPGTPIHLLSSADSPVIAKATDAPATVVESTDGAWSKVTYSGPVTLRFQVVAAPLGTNLPTILTGTAAAPAATPPPAPAPTPPAPKSPPPIANPAPQYYVGLLQVRTDPTISGPASAQYLLIGPQNQLVALVDLNSVILTQPMTAYLGRQVKVYGLGTPQSSYPTSIVLKAQMLQLLEP